MQNGRGSPRWFALTFCESRTDYRVLATRRKTHTAKSASGPAKTASEPQMPGRGLNQKTVTTMWRFCDITGRNRPVLSLHHIPAATTQRDARSRVLWE